MELDVVQLGFLSSVVAGVVNLFPAFAKSDIMRALVAIVVTTLFVFFMGAEFSFEAVMMSLAFALTTFKMVVQPISEKLK